VDTPHDDSSHVIRFGVFEADTRTGELRRGGRRIGLQEQPFRVLCVLLERPGELVTRQELRLRLWGADHFVDFEHGLNKAINKLREALGDDREAPRYIETLPRRGYRFIAPTSGGPAAEPAEGEGAAAETGGEAPRRGPMARAATVAGLASLVLAAALLWHWLGRGWPLYPAAAAAAAPIRSLAVLPLQSLSADSGQEYFAEGMTDELITDLGQMSELRVISRTSAMRYRASSKTLPQIGRELRADAIVEGTVFSSGGRVRITAQLIDARTDRHLWAQEYERDLRDVLDLQDEVARDIATAIKVELTPQERALLGGTHPVDPAAHAAYLKGRYYWNRFTRADVERSVGFFRQATESDPSYALGYSGLADAYSVLYVRFGALPRSRACPQAEEAAVRAVALGDSLAEPHHSLAAIRLFCDWDWQGAERGLRRAIELNRNYAEPRRVYADLLAFLGRGDEAVAQTERAVENNPMSPDVGQSAGWVYYLTRRYDQAFRQYGIALALDPNRPESHWGLGNVYLQRGRLDLAIREYRTAAALSGDGSGYLASLGYAEALAGKRAEAQAILTRLNQRSLSRPVSAVDRALVYAGLGDRREALAWLDKAYEQHDVGMLGLKAVPAFDGLRSDPRFQALLRRVGF
jgi:TolB-like protein/DNA-binding winged helix-turn-helix (wHTH) protein/Flp pilus assembly protein TadD